MTSKNCIEAIDLFCGIGGLSYGLKKAGIVVKAGLDADGSCKYAYEKNIKAEFIEANIDDYDMAQLKKYYSKNSIKVLVGCAPCQPFSAHSHKIKNKKEDKRWHLIDYFVEAVKVLNPDIISMENVRGITKTEVFEEFVKNLRNLGYQIDHKVIYCPDYGIPQSRSRLVLLGSKKEGLIIPKKTYRKEAYKTVADTIKKLPALKQGGADKKDGLHKAKGLFPINIERIKQSKQKGTWRDWDKDLLPNCYKKPSGQTYSSVYGRMGWDDVAPTITTQFYNYGSGRFGHPEQNRALSLREGALLQTFPLKYDFGVVTAMVKTGMHIGNAVPPKLGRIIGKSILGHIENTYDK